MIIGCRLPEAHLGEGVPITYEIEPRAGVLILRVTVRFDFDEVDALYATLQDRGIVPHELPFLWDFTEIEPVEWDAEFIARCVALDRRFRNIQRAPQAIVTSEPVVADGVDRYIGRVTNQSFAPVIRHFRGSRTDLAIEWLTSFDPPPGPLS